MCMCGWIPALLTWNCQSIVNQLYPNTKCFWCEKKIQIVVSQNFQETIKKLRQPKYSSKDEWINKMWCIYTMEYCSAIKRNEVLMHSVPWVNLKNIMLSERNQTTRAIYCMIPLIWIIQNRQFPRDKKHVGDCQELRRAGGRKDDYWMDTGFPLGTRDRWWLHKWMY